MVFSNAKLAKKRGGLKNRGHVHLEEGETQTLDLSEFQIPRYEELKMIRLDEFEE